MNYLFMAIQLLRPTAEFSFTDQDYSTVIWTKLDGDAPTQAEVNAAIEQVKVNEIAAAEAAATDKANATSKLEALGLTADDLKALGL
jgi:hypothetical protein